MLAMLLDQLLADAMKFQGGGVDGDVHRPAACLGAGQRRGECETRAAPRERCVVRYAHRQAEQSHNRLEQALVCRQGRPNARRSRCPVCDRIGRGVIADLVRLDRQITGIARHRMRSGGKPGDSTRYCALVQRVRGMLRTLVNAALNRLVVVHAPGELVVEGLDFRSPALSRRMSRLVQNCGRAVFRQKLADLRERSGIEAVEVASPHMSQEYCSCGYVDRRNRRSQSEFRSPAQMATPFRWFWGSRKHADPRKSLRYFAEYVACVVTQTCSLESGAATRGKAAILAELVRRFCERWRRPLGGAADPRLSNPHFAAWAMRNREAICAGVVRTALATQGMVPKAQ